MSIFFVQFDLIHMKLRFLDCTDEKFRNLYNLELFIDQLCTAVNKIKESSVILHHNILLENYIGLGSIIHNRNSLGFFKVRGKFSF